MSAAPEPELPAQHRRLVDALMLTQAVREAPARAAARERDEPVERRTGRRWVVRVLVVAAAVLLAGVLIASALVWRQALSAADAAGQRSAAVASAKTAVAAVMSYDYRHLARDITTTSRYIAGNFRAQYLTAMSDEVKPRAPLDKTVVTGHVLHAAIESFDSAGTQATVLVFGQQSVTSSSHPSPTLSPTQLRAVVQRIGRRWLLVQLTQLG